MHLAVELVASLRILSLSSSSPLAPNIEDNLSTSFGSLSITNPIFTSGHQQLQNIATPPPNHIPHHIFPQLPSLTKGINKTLRLPLSPLLMNWEYVVRPDRPFERVNFRHPAPPPPQPAVVIPDDRPARQVPTAYYLEQAPFYAENHGPDPFVAEPAVLKPAPLRALVLTIFNFFSANTLPFLNPLLAIATTIIAFFQALAYWGLVYPVRMGLGAIGSIEWAFFGLFVLATQAVWLLPAWSGEAVKQREVVVPVYRIFVSGGREAIGTGPVSVREF